MSTSTGGIAVETSATRRITSVVKLHFVNPWLTVIVPWAILGLIFLVNLVVWWVILRAAGSSADQADAGEGFQYSGATSYIFVYMLIVAVQAMSVTFPFALGYGVTRRDYYVGTAVTFVLLSAMFAVGMATLGAIEEATNGWGLGGRMFTAVYFGDGGWFSRLFIFFVTLLFFFFVGAAVASVWVRWKATGLTAFFVIATLVLVGIAALATVTSSWLAVREFFANAGTLGSFAWSLVLTAIAAVAGYFILRRATPRS